MTTDKDGRIERDITVSKRSLEDKEALFVTISIPNPYYNDKHFKTLRQKLNLTAYAQEKNKEITLDKEITQKAIDAIKGKSGSSNQNVESFENNDADFGQLTAKTNAYRLIVDVNKLYPKYDLIESKDKKTRKMELSKEKHGSDVNVTAYDVDMKKPINGLPMIIYRKNKRKYIPTYEGNISSNAPKSETTGNNGKYSLAQATSQMTSTTQDDKEDITIVAVGKTVMNAKNDSSTVTFEKLLSTDNVNDSYFIIAVRNVNDWIQEQRKKGLHVGVQGEELKGLINSSGTYFDEMKMTGESNSMIANVIGVNTAQAQTNTSGAVSQANANIQGLGSLGGGYTPPENIGLEFDKDGGFIAEAMPFKLPKKEDIYYQTAKTEYNIISRKPPTSIFKGRLMYAWPSEPNNLRPLPNTRFRVITDYVSLNNLSVGAVNASQLKDEGGRGLPVVQNENGERFNTHDAVFVNSDNDTIILADHRVTMGTAKTDANGYFEIEVVNINSKGSLKAGKLYRAQLEQIKDPEAKQEAFPGIISGIEGFGKMFGGAGLEAIINWGDFDKITNPGDNMQGAIKAQQSINSYTNVSFDAATHSYDVTSQTQGLGGNVIGGKQKVMRNTSSYDDNSYAETTNQRGGPNPILDAQNPNIQINRGGEVTSSQIVSTPSVLHTLNRVFRIKIDGAAKDFYHQSKDVVVIQPFEIITESQTITHYVRESQVMLNVIDNATNKPITEKGIQATIFRDITHKPAELPQGEGDGKYLYSPLIQATYAASTGNRPKYEHLWSGLDIESKEIKPMKRLAGGALDTYWISVSSYLSSEVSKAYRNNEDLLLRATVIRRENDDKSDEEKTIKPIPSIRHIEVRLDPLPSRLIVSLRDSANQVPLDGKQYAGRVYYTDASKQQKTAPVDAHGKVEITGSNLKLNQDNVTIIPFYARAKGFKESDTKTASLQKTGSQFFATLGLVPSSHIKGRVVSKEAKKEAVHLGASSIIYPVPSWIRMDEGKYFETKDDGHFDLPLPIKDISNFEIKPKDVGYFDSIKVIRNADVRVVNLGNIELKRQRHRIKVNVSTTNENGLTKQLPNSVVTLADMERKTNNDGDAYFSFENVSVNSYKLIVRGPQGASYIPKTIDIANEESKDYVTYKVTLSAGSVVSGTVHLDGKPIRGAKVYLDVTHNLSNVEEGTLTNPNANLTYAYSDANGKYMLRGVPINNQKVSVRAVLDTTFTVNGDKKLVQISNKMGKADFNLQKFGDHVINKVFGFPLTVEKIEKVDEKNVKVTGTVNWTMGISNFKMDDATKLARIEDVPFELTEINGNKVGIPKKSEIPLSGITKLKLSLMDKYNVELSSHKQHYNASYGYKTVPLLIVKDKNRGKISGNMRIVDNSFNYPDDYLKFTETDQFHLATLDGKNLNQVIDVVTAAFAEKEAYKPAFNESGKYADAVQSVMNLPENSALTPKYSGITLKNTSSDASAANRKSLPVYYLSKGNKEPIKFKLIRFDATADPMKSYINDEGKIRLDANIKVNMPNARPERFDVNIPGVMLDEREVYPASGAGPLKVALEDWTLEVKDWKFSVEEGGITSSNARIHTPIVDIPVRRFVLRNDMFVMDKFVMSDLTLGGGKFKLQIDTTVVKPSLTFEQKTGMHMTPHWNFSLLSVGKSKAASMPLLNELVNYQVEFDYIQILSNNEMSVQLKQQEKEALLMGNEKAKFKPLLIVNGSNYIKLLGSLNVGAPRLGDIELIAKWTAPHAKPTFEPVSFDFETKGFVHFTAKESPIFINKSNIAVLNGQVAEKPADSFEPMPAHFFCLNEGTIPYAVRVKKGHTTKLSDGYQLIGTNGGMYVEGGDWNLLKFNGLIVPTNPQDNSDIRPSHTEFSVLGAIKAITFNANVDGSLGVDKDNMGVTGKVKGSVKVDIDYEKPEFVQQIEGNIEHIKGEIADFKADVKEKYKSLTEHKISTPLGEMTQVFDFPNGRLIGGITMKNVVLGGMTIYTGTIETCIDREGFYVAGGCNAFIPLGILSGNYNLGLMVGYHSLSDHLWGVTNKYIDSRVQNICYKRETPQLSGIYSVFNREILNVEYPYVFPPVGWGKLRAVALIGGDMYFNITKERNAWVWKLGMGAYAHLDVGAYVNCLGVATIDGSLTLDGKMNFILTTPLKNSYIGAHLGLDFNAKACIGVGGLQECASTGVTCSMKASSDGFKFSLNQGKDKFTCP